MKFNPVGKFKKSYEAGGKAYREGVKITDNPLLNQPVVGMASWREAGWLHEKTKENRDDANSRDIIQVAIREKPSNSGGISADNWKQDRSGS